MVKIGNKVYVSLSEASREIGVNVNILKRLVVYRKEVNGEKAELITNKVNNESIN